MTIKRSLLVTISLIGLSSCALFETPPQTQYADGSVMQGQAITVNQGDTLYGIAKNNRVSMRDLIAVNQLQQPYKLQPGQTLYLPALGKVPPGGSIRPIASPSMSVQSEPLAPLNSRVETQELPPPTTNFNAGYSRPTAELQWQTQPLQTPSQLRRNAPPLITEQTVSSTANPPPSIETYSLPDPNDAMRAGKGVPLNPRSDFRWPVEGPVVSKYGPKEKGLNNDGINIAAPRGAPVLASAGGIVVYAGNEMKGFGNLVLIRHEDNWVTAYAHLERILVEVNSVVTQGDMIGTVGTSGGVSTPQLHFEVRENGKAVDPSGMLPAI